MTDASQGGLERSTQHVHRAVVPVPCLPPSIDPLYKKERFVYSKIMRNYRVTSTRDLNIRPAHSARAVTFFVGAAQPRLLF